MDICLVSIQCTYDTGVPSAAWLVLVHTIYDTDSFSAVWDVDAFITFIVLITLPWQMR